MVRAAVYTDPRGTPAPPIFSLGTSRPASNVWLRGLPRQVPRKHEQQVKRHFEAPRGKHKFSYGHKLATDKIGFGDFLHKLHLPDINPSGPSTRMLSTQTARLIISYRRHNPRTGNMGQPNPPSRPNASRARAAKFYNPPFSSLFIPPKSGQLSFYP